MDPTTRRVLLSSSKKGGPVYVDDVFSTHLFEGTSSSNPINNGIDLAGEGGMVWIKPRDYNSGLSPIHDTERSAMGQRLSTSSSDLQYAYNPFASINNNGFTLTGSGTAYNNSSYNYVSWTFRKAPGFFDVVTYTGNGTAGRTVAHSLGSVPGMIIVKCTSTAGTNWLVYHRSLGATKATLFDLANAQVGPSANYWNNTAPTSTQFTLGISNDVNTNGDTYVAYIFAHDDARFGTDGNESVIKCGIYTGNGSNDGPEINLGFEPQWVMTKAVSQSRNWLIGDVMRGAPVSSGAQDAAKLSANTSDAEILGDEPFVPTPTGFKVRSNSGSINDNNLTYIYIAIRRPHKPPEAATEVFAVDYGNGSSTIPNFDSGFPVDFAIAKLFGATDDHETIARLTGKKSFKTSSNAASVSNGSNWVTDSNAGWGKVDYSSTRISWMFKRAPGFFDVVAYSGGGSTTKNHNLEAVPELMIVKVRNANGQWYVYSSATGASKYSLLSSDAAAATGVTWGVTDSTFTVFAGANDSNETYISYLFATLPGISKVGTYSSNNTNKYIDCGFTNGCRFVLIKRTDAAGDWYVWDTARGIGAISYTSQTLKLNSTDAQSANSYLFATTDGFLLAQGLFGNDNNPVNKVGGTYIFLAIA